MTTYKPTNAEFIKDLMDFSKQGSAMHAFVLEGLHAYADQVLRAKKWTQESTITHEERRACALELLGKLLAKELS